MAANLSRKVFSIPIPSKWSAARTSLFHKPVFQIQQILFGQGADSLLEPQAVEDVIVARLGMVDADQRQVAFGVKDAEVVDLKVPGERGAVFLNVVCRVNPAYALECHLDFDEGNAVGIGNGAIGEIIRRS